MNSKLFGSKLRNCPPPDAEIPNVVVYYLVSHNPPIKEDFKPLIKRIKDFKPRYDKEKEECEAHGLSVYTDMNDAIITRENRNSLRDKKLAVGKLNFDCGLMKETPKRDRPSHHTWWFPYGMEIWNLFEVIDCKGDYDV